MPLYPYECDHCDHAEEVLEAFDARIAKCPKCGRKWRRNIGLGIGKMYKPDREKVLSTMKMKVNGVEQ